MKILKLPIREAERREWVTGDEEYRLGAALDNEIEPMINPEEPEDDWIQRVRRIRQALDIIHDNLPGGVTAVSLDGLPIYTVEDFCRELWRVRLRPLAPKVDHEERRVTGWIKL